MFGTYIYKKLYIIYMKFKPKWTSCVLSVKPLLYRPKDNLSIAEIFESTETNISLIKLPFHCFLPSASPIFLEVTAGNQKHAII